MNIWLVCWGAWGPGHGLGQVSHHHLQPCSPCVSPEQVVSKTCQPSGEISLPRGCHRVIELLCTGRDPIFSLDWRSGDTRICFSKSCIRNIFMTYRDIMSNSLPSAVVASPMTSGLFMLFPLIPPLTPVVPLVCVRQWHSQTWSRTVGCWGVTAYVLTLYTSSIIVNLLPSLLADLE